MIDDRLESVAGSLILPAVLLGTAVIAVVAAT